MGRLSRRLVKPLLLLLAGSLALAGAGAQPAAVEPADSEGALSDRNRVVAEIMPLFTAMQDAANAHDAEAHLACYMRSPALTFVVNGTVIRGWDALLAQQRKWWPGGRIAPTDAAHQPYRLVAGPDFVVGPGLAMVTFVVDARRVRPEGTTLRPLAISQLWRKRAEGWRIVHAHESLGPERPGD